MLSKNQTKFIISLRRKKHRSEQKLFIVEGIKIVREFLLSGLELHQLFCTEDIINSYQKYKPQVISERELSKISNLSTSNKVLGLFRTPILRESKTKGLIVALDHINDPGNLGTIIRLCDWFGISQIVCSNDTVDCYNPKVVQSSMGSLSRIPILYTNIEEYINQTSLPVYGAVMDGDSVTSKKLEQNAILIMGSESHGISKALATMIQYKLTIAKFTQNSAIDSLNVATATAILLHEFRRQT